MIALTKPQRQALKQVFDRQPLYRHIDNQLPHGIICSLSVSPFAATYRQFRRTVRGGPGCVMVPWCNMWLGIEPDGYTHS